MSGAKAESIARQGPTRLVENAEECEQSVAPATPPSTPFYPGPVPAAGVVGVSTHTPRVTRSDPTPVARAPSGTDTDPGKEGPIRVVVTSVYFPVGPHPPETNPRGCRRPPEEVRLGDSPPSLRVPPETPDSGVPGPLRRSPPNRTYQ